MLSEYVGEYVGDATEPHCRLAFSNGTLWDNGNVIPVQSYLATTWGTSI